MRQCQECKHWTRYECEGNTYFWGRCSWLVVHLENRRAELLEAKDLEEGEVADEVERGGDLRPLDTDEDWGCVNFEEAA